MLFVPSEKTQTTGQNENREQRVEDFGLHTHSPRSKGHDNFADHTDVVMYLGNKSCKINCSGQSATGEGNWLLGPRFLFDSCRKHLRKGIVASFD